MDSNPIVKGRDRERSRKNIGETIKKNLDLNCEYVHTHSNIFYFLFLLADFAPYFVTTVVVLSSNWVL